MRADFDAIAVGGGLAGSAFALALSRAGYRVAIVERSAQAQLKVCGDFLSEEAQRLLRALGLDIHEFGATRISQFRMATGGRAALAPLPFEAVGLTRLLLDESLLDHAAGSGVEIIRGQSVTKLELEGSVPAVYVADKRFTAKNVALATGKHNLRGCQRSKGHLSAYKMTFELARAAREGLSDIVQLVGYSGGYIGACNVEGGASTLCWLVDKSLLEQCGSGWSEQLSELSRRSCFVGDIISGARPVFEKPATVSSIPYGYQRREALHPKVFALGDQVAVIPSFTGDGTSIALLSGLAAAEAVQKNERAQVYQNRILADLASQFRWAAAIDFGFKSALTRNLSVTAVRAVPGLATHLTRRTRLSEKSLSVIDLSPRNKR